MMKGKIKATALAAAMLMGAPVQAVVYQVGGYSFDESAFITDVLSFSGDFLWDGSSWVDPVANPGNVTDYSAATYLATGYYSGTSNVNNVWLRLGFGGVRVIDGPGADMALFFAGDSPTGDNSVTLFAGEGVVPLTLSDVYDDAICGGQCFVEGTDIPLKVAEVDIADFYVSELTSFEMQMNQGDPDWAVAFAVGAAMNTAPVPVPAAVWLFGSGLLGLVGVARRRR